MNLFVKIFGSYEGHAALDGATADVKELHKESDAAAKGGLASLKSGLGDISKIAGGFVIGQAMTKLPGLLSDASKRSKELELETKKANIVFGDQIGVVDDWAKQNASSFGLSTAMARNLAAGMADLLVPMGMTREAAAEMATKTIGLSGALAEWSGGQKNAAEVSEILQKAYLGETDGLKALGVSISAADISSRLALKGQDKLTDSALAQAKAVAIQELIFEKSTDAQAAFADGADSAARKQSLATAKINEAKDSLAIGLAPAIAAGTAALAELVTIVAIVAENSIPALTAAIDVVVGVFGFLAEHKAETIAAVAGIAAAILTVMIPAAIAWAAAEWAKVTALIAATVAMIAANAPIIAVAAVIALLVAGIILLVTHWGAITEKIPALGVAFDAVKVVIEAVIAYLTGDFLKDAQGALDSFGAAFDIAEKVIRPQLELIKNVIDAQLIIFRGLFDVFNALLHGDFDAAWAALKGIVTGVLDEIKDSIGIAIQAVKDLAPMMLEAGKSLGSALLDGLKAALSATAGFAGDVGNAVLSAVKSIINSQVIDRLNSALEFSFDTHIPGVGSISINPSDIPHLARGGITNGPTLAVIGDNPGGREAIIPLGADGRIPGSGLTFNIYALDGDSVKKAIPEIARQLKIHQRQAGFSFA